MVKVLFLIHDLGQGGAEKVLVNLVNHMDLTKFDISVTALFGGGVNEQFLRPEIKYKIIFKKCFPGNSHLMKLLSPEKLHDLIVTEDYDIEISYLEGPSARIISGCRNKNTKLVSWIHCTMGTQKEVAASFRNINEAQICYNAMDKLIFVSEGVRKSFKDNCNYKGSTKILYNTVESERILQLAKETVNGKMQNAFNLIAVGTLKPVKGFDRLFQIIKRLKENAYNVHLYILGVGPQQRELEKFIEENSLSEEISLLGYDTNPYKYISRSSLFICSSYSEGFSTTVTEALILGIPICTTKVSGMKELLGEKNEYGIVTENNEEALYQGIVQLLDNPALLEHYKEQSEKRGKSFCTANTVSAVEKVLLSM